MVAKTPVDNTKKSSTAICRTACVIRNVILRVLRCEILLQRCCKLVGAGSALHSAFDTLEAGDCFVDFHSLHKRANALKIAVATAKVTHVVKLAVYYFELYFARTYSASCVFHFVLLLILHYTSLRSSRCSTECRENISHACPCGIYAQ